MKILKTMTFLFVIATALSCQNGKAKNVEQEIIELIVVSDLQKQNTESIQLVDVRTPREVEQGMILGAQHMDYMGDDFLEQTESLDKSEPVYLYCKSGGRSARAAKKLRDAGFTKVYDVDGGITAWNKAGYETVK